MNLEEEYKNRFKDQGTSQGIDAEELWQGIAGELDATAQRPKGKRTPIKRWLLALLFVCFGALVIYNFPMESSKDAKDLEKSQSPTNDTGIASSPVATEPGESKKETLSPEATLLKKQAPLIAKDQTEKQVATALSQQERKNTSFTSDHNQIETGPTISTVGNHTSVDSGSTIKTTSKDDLNSSKTPIITHKEISSSANKNLNSLIEHNAPTINISAISEKDISKSTTKTNSRPAAYAAAPLLDRIPFSFIKNEVEPALELSLESFTPPTKVYRPNSFQVSVLSGVNVMFSGYRKNNDDALSTALKNSSSSMSGLSTSARLSWLKKGKFSLSTGINYEAIRIKFSTVKETTTMVLRENYLTGFAIDPQSGDTINQTYESRMQDALARRTVLHHNSFKLITIPLEAGIQQHRGKWTYGLNLGIGANFFLSQKGKTLDQQGSIHVIDDSINEELPFKKFFLSYHLNPFVDYSLSKSLNLRLSPVLKYQVHGTSELYGLKQYAVYTAVNVGVVFNLE